jgi:hypothetical protein
LKYYVISPAGRTGSRRLFSLLHRHFNDKKETSVDYDVGGDQSFKKKELPMMETKLRFIVSQYEKGKAISREQNWDTSLAEIAEILKNAEDETCVHSHSSAPLLDGENWVVIFSNRKSKAEQVMSKLIGEYLGTHDPLEADKKFEPFSVTKEKVQWFCSRIEWKDTVCKELYPNHIEIFMEDSLETIEEKLMLKFDRNKRTETANKKFISNHRYKDLITNYKEVFEWCGESYE